MKSLSYYEKTYLKLNSKLWQIYQLHLELHASYLVYNLSEFFAPFIHSSYLLLIQHLLCNYYFIPWAFHHWAHKRIWELGRTKTVILMPRKLREKCMQMKNFSLQTWNENTHVSSEWSSNNTHCKKPPNNQMTKWSSL